MVSNTWIKNISRSMNTNILAWLEESKHRFESNRLNGALYSIYLLYVASLLSTTSKYPIGTNIYEKDWDLLVILDCCRVDAITAVASEYAQIKNVDSICSVGSSSFEWMTQTFDQEYSKQINQTNYISANPYVERTFLTEQTPPNNSEVPFEPHSYNTVHYSEFDNVCEMKESWISPSTGCVLPSTMTDIAINSIKSNDSEYNIVHYMQPHEPHIGNKYGLGQGVCRGLKYDDIAKEDAWLSYMENLRYVLDEVSILLDNVDAESAYITADHGEAFGEYGFHGHNVASPVPQVKIVPWVEVNAKDKNTHIPPVKRATQGNNPDLEDHFEALGYL